MTKPWSEQPLWWKVYLRDDRVHLEAGKLIGHLGCTPSEFWDRAKKLPNYDQYRFENAVRDLTVYARREASQPRFELTAEARKVLRVVLGPAPDDPEYGAWWRARLVSVRQMREQGLPVTHAAEPPVPLPEDATPAPTEQRKPGKKTASRPAKAPEATAQPEAKPTRKRQPAKEKPAEAKRR